MNTLIAGGGPAGAAAACLLGPDAVLVEREARPHDKVCGEFLSVEALHYLRRLGISPAQLGASPIGGVRLVHGRTTAAAALPFPAAGLSRRALDAALLARAAAGGATLLLGRRVRRVVDGVAEVEGEGRMPARRLLLATGKHELRGAQRALARAPERLVGLKMHLRLAPAQAAALAGWVEVVLFPGGYGGLQPVEAGLANLCVLIERDRFREAGDGWAGLSDALRAAAPHLATRLDGAAAAWDRPLAIADVPYGFVHRPSPADSAALFRLGDQAAVIPSFSGDGMSMALHSAFRAAGEARLWPGGLRWAARLTRLPALAV